jgi:hypothetical protein
MKKSVEVGAEDGNQRGGGSGLIICGTGPGPMTRDRRIVEFARHLELMAQRAKRGDCYIIFDVQHGQGGKAKGKMPRGIKDRFVQFWFYSKGGFFLELPNTTLTAKEAKIILRDKPGFALAESDDPDSDVSHFHPLRREYGCGEEEAAARDMVFILCDLWKLPVDVALDVTGARATSSEGQIQQARRPWMGQG